MPFPKKNKSERLSEVIKVLKQLHSFGFPKENKNIIKMSDILKKWVQDGIYQKGRIYLNGYERVILYELYPNKGKEIAVNLKYIKGL